MKKLLTTLLLLLATTQAIACTTAVLSGRFTKSGRPMIWKLRDTEAYDNHMPVSYTHLDVYKRQERTIPPEYKSQHPKDAEKAKRQEEAAEWHEKQAVKKAEKQREKELQAEEQKKLEKEGLQKEQEDKPTETSNDNDKDKK